MRIKLSQESAAISVETSKEADQLTWQPRSLQITLQSIKYNRMASNYVRQQMLRRNKIIGTRTPLVSVHCFDSTSLTSCCYMMTIALKTSNLLQQTHFSLGICVSQSPFSVPMSETQYIHSTKYVVGYQRFWFTVTSIVPICRARRWAAHPAVLSPSPYRIYRYLWSIQYYSSATSKT